MKITITKEQAEKIGMKALVPFTGDKDSWGYRSERSINLVTMVDARLDTLEQLLTKALPMPGIKGALADMAANAGAAEGAQAGTESKSKERKGIDGEAALIHDVFTAAGFTRRPKPVTGQPDSWTHRGRIRR